MRGADRARRYAIPFKKSRTLFGNAGALTGAGHVLAWELCGDDVGGWKLGFADVSEDRDAGLGLGDDLSAERVAGQSDGRPMGGCCGHGRPFLCALDAPQ